MFRYAPRARPVLRVKKHPIIGSLLPPPRETSHYAAHFTPKGDLCLSPTRVSFRTADFRLKQKITKGERRGKSKLLQQRRIIFYGKILLPFRRYLCSLRHPLSGGVLFSFRCSCCPLGSISPTVGGTCKKSQLRV